MVPDVRSEATLAPSGAGVAGWATRGNLDELFVTLNGRQQYLWRAVDEDSDVLDILVQSRRGSFESY